MKKARILFGVIAVIFCVSMIAACGQPGAVPSTTGGSPQTTASAAATTAAATTAAATTAASPPPVKSFTVYYGDSNAVPVSYFDTPVGKKISEITGYRAEYEFIVGNDETTKVGVIIASGDYPDIVNGHERHRQFVEAGAVIPIEDLIA